MKKKKRKYNKRKQTGIPADWWNHKINPILGYRVPPVHRSRKPVENSYPNPIKEQ